MPPATFIRGHIRGEIIMPPITTEVEFRRRPRVTTTLEAIRRMAKLREKLAVVLIWI